MNTALSVAKGLFALGPAYHYLFTTFAAHIFPHYVDDSEYTVVRAKEAVPDLFARVDGIRKDILIYMSNTSEYGVSYGSSFSPKAAITIGQELQECSENVFSFTLKQEISRIHLNEDAKTYGMATLCLVIVGIAITILEPNLPWYAAPVLYVIPYLAKSRIFSFMFAENQLRTHAFVVKHADNDELREMVDFYQTINILAVKKINQERAQRGIRQPIPSLPRDHNRDRIDLLLKELRDRN